MSFEEGPTLAENILYAIIHLMKNTSTVGKIGEDIACAYLEGRGFRIIERNFRRPWGELDIIARAEDKTLVFVEVKAMKIGHARGAAEAIAPEDNMTPAKIRKTRKIAAMYANDNPKSMDENAGWRIDLVAISIPEDAESSLTDLIKNCEIKYFENVE